MRNLAACIAVESKKLFRSRIPAMTLLALTLVPLMGGFFMFVLKDPNFARRLGFISAKAQIAGAADWPSYLALLSQAIAVGGLMVFGFIFSWVFGREYADRTLQNLLALPISRGVIVSAKFIVAAYWCLLSSAYAFILGLAVGKLVVLPGWSPAAFLQGLNVFAFSAVLTVLVSLPVAFFASAGRGYLPALGFVVFSLVLAQIAAAAGYGQFFPWSVPALASGLAGSEYALLPAGSVVSVCLTGVFGLMGTILWWRYADQY